MTTPFLVLPELGVGMANPDTLLNAALRALDAAVNIDVLDRTLITPPIAPPETSRYIIPAGAVGSWSNRTDKVAYYVNGAWGFLTPRKGWLAYVEDEDLFYEWSGTAWGQIAADSPNNASEVTYDNTVSMLASSNAQDAILELVDKLDALVGGTEPNCPQPQDYYDSIMALTPTAYWRCDEATGTQLDDSSGNGHHMTLVGTYTQAQSALVPAYPFKEYLWLNGGANSGGSRSGTLGLTMPLTGDWTVVLIMASQNIVSSGPMFAITGTTESEANNNQIYVGMTAAGFSRLLWEHGAGIDDEFISAVGPFLEGQAYHCAWVKDGTANTVTFYVNGIWFQTTSYATEPTGGSTAATYLGYNTSNGHEGLIGEVAFFNGVMLTQDQIATLAFNAGMLAA